MEKRKERQSSVKWQQRSVEDALKGDKKGLKGDGEELKGNRVLLFYCIYINVKVDISLYILSRW